MVRSFFALSLVCPVFADEEEHQKTNSLEVTESADDDRVPRPHYIDTHEQKKHWDRRDGLFYKIDGKSVGLGSFAIAYEAFILREQDFPNKEEDLVHIPHDIIRFPKTADVPERIIVKRFTDGGNTDDEIDKEIEIPWEEGRTWITRQHYFDIAHDEEDASHSQDVFIIAHAREECLWSTRLQKMGGQEHFMRCFGTNIPSKDDLKKGTTDHNEPLYACLSLAGYPLRHQVNTFTPQDAFGVVYQLMEVLDFMHKAGVVHHDLKLDNVMYDKESKRVIVVDFGSMTRNDVNAKTLNVPMTPTFIAPEFYLGPAHQENTNTSYDIFAIACTIGEMFAYLSPMRQYMVGNNWDEEDYIDWTGFFDAVFEADARTPKVGGLTQVIHQSTAFMGGDRTEFYRGQLYDEMCQANAKWEDLYARLFSKNPEDRIAAVQNALKNLEPPASSRYTKNMKRYLPSREKVRAHLPEQGSATSYVVVVISALVVAGILLYLMKGARRPKARRSGVFDYPVFEMTAGKDLHPRNVPIEMRGACHV
jgi:hypothetical protein